MAPIDKHNMVYIIFLLHGIGTLLPWNVIINVYSYFVDYKLNLTDDSPERQKNYRKNFLQYLGIASKAPNLLFQIINLFAVESILGQMSTRILVALVVEIIYFIFAIALALINTESSIDLFFWLTIMSTIVVNMANGVYQSCAYGTAAILPQKYTNAVTIGMNFSGVFFAIFNIMAKTILPSPQLMAQNYFLGAVLVLIVCLISELILKTNEFYNYYKKLEKEKPENESKLDAKPSLDPMEKSENRYLIILKKIFPQLLDIFLIYFVSFSLFPAVLANIEPSNSLINVNYFSDVFCFLVFNLFTFVGNMSAEYISFPDSDLMIGFTSFRFLFIPFYLFCKYEPKSHTRSLFVLFSSDWLYLLANILLAFSGGHLSALCLMYCPRSVPKHYSSTAGMMAAFTILLGILFGLYFSLVFPVIV